jgi:hypothetical protein
MERREDVASKRRGKRTHAKHTEENLEAPETMTLEVKPHFRPGTVKSQGGQVLQIPEGWGLLEPGDATLTRRVKKAGPSWTIKEKKGRRVFSQGVLASAVTIEAERAALEAERETDAYKKSLARSRERRAKEQETYVEDFHGAVLEFLAFAPEHADMAQALASAVTAHATPVGSGTVARTARIPIEERAEAAVIAWMRHQTTAYDTMSIPRIKGMRREVRRKLAARSRELLSAYRENNRAPASDCPLRAALDRADDPT